MTHFGYIIAGYGLTTALLGGYAVWIMARYRSLLRLGIDTAADVAGANPMAPVPADADAAGSRAPAS